MGRLTPLRPVLPFRRATTSLVAYSPLWSIAKLPACLSAYGWLMAPRLHPATPLHSDLLYRTATRTREDGNADHSFPFASGHLINRENPAQAPRLGRELIWEEFHLPWQPNPPFHGSVAMCLALRTGTTPSILLVLAVCQRAWFSLWMARRAFQRDIIARIGGGRGIKGERLGIK
ncbi:hypothetical protein BS78_04G276000 [Paspalum vaginatum]|nr:hypothetical protein BS78_04G276000 [Paspalum vaginatum]